MSRELPGAHLLALTTCARTYKLSPAWCTSPNCYNAENTCARQNRIRLIGSTKSVKRLRLRHRLARRSFHSRCGNGQIMKAALLVRRRKKSWSTAPTVLPICCQYLRLYRRISRLFRPSRVPFEIESSTFCCIFSGDSGRVAFFWRVLSGEIYTMPSVIDFDCSVFGDLSIRFVPFFSGYKA